MYPGKERINARSLREQRGNLDPDLNNIQSLIRQVMTQILGWFRLANGIKINQPTSASIKDQLSVGKIAMAEA